MSEAAAWRKGCWQFSVSKFSASKAEQHRDAQLQRPQHVEGEKSRSCTNL
jgi:hypothetical protein